LEKKFIFFLQYHHYHIIKVENEQSSIEKHEVEPSGFPTGCSRDSRADEEKHIHIKACDYSKSTDSVDNRGDVGDVKLIGLVKFEVVDEFFKHCGLPLLFLSVYIIPHLKRFVKGFWEKSLKKFCTKIC
jgi:hypothetical protein